MGAVSRQLNLWHRLSIVVTVLWLLIGTHQLWLAQVQANYQFAATMAHMCEGTDGYPSSGRPIEQCLSEYNEAMNRYGNERWSLLGVTFLVTLGAAALFWLLIGLAYWTVRWILAGRKPRDSN